jgi:NodT family efflux transporter outer membrane factor (OMF) lipoprotein
VDTRPLVGSLVLVALLAGCADMKGLGTQAAVSDPNQLRAEQSLAATGVSALAWPHDDWWEQFDDPQLDRLVQEGLAGSPTLRVAAARVRKAHAFADVSRSRLFPQINGDLESSRQRLSNTGLAPIGLIGSNWITQTQLEATLGYELDLWGKNRAAHESALGLEQAAKVDAFAARLSLASSIALAYAQLQHAYLRLDVAQATLEQREHIYALTRQRVEAGLDSRLELKQAESALPASREQIAQWREVIDLTRDQLAALVGQGPDRGLLVARPVPRALGPVVLPARLPAELLGRRPDIVAQRLRVEAARRDIDVAKAQFYPNVDLNAFLGLQSIQLPGFLQGGNRTMGIGPAVTLPIFDGGRLRGNLGGRNADYDTAVELYNQTLIDGLREVVDQLNSFKRTEEQRAEQILGLAAAQEAYDIALTRYREGFGTYLEVLSAESQLLAQRGLDADLRARQLELSVNLIRALGGGFGNGAGAAPAESGSKS